MERGGREGKMPKDIGGDDAGLGDGVVRSVGVIWEGRCRGWECGDRVCFC